MLRATINGKSHEFEESITIIDAARSLGADIPILCHDERSKPAGSCRPCVVEVKGWSHPAISCHTQLIDGMVIQTETESLRAERKGVLSLLAHRYPREALQQTADKTFHGYLNLYDLLDEVSGSKDSTLIDDSHPYIHVDMNRCIESLHPAVLCPLLFFLTCEELPQLFRINENASKQSSVEAAESTMKNSPAHWHKRCSRKV